MKKLALITALILLACVMWGQTWIVESNDFADVEFTVINRESFERIKRANELTAEYVVIQYNENTGRTDNSNIISGTKPTFNGEFYLSARQIAKDDEWGFLVNSIIINTICIGNSNIGIITIVYCKVPQNGSISLRTERQRYEETYNSLLELIRTR